MNILRIARSTLNILPEDLPPSSIPQRPETPVALPVCSSTVFISCEPSSPSIIAITIERARSGSFTCTPCSSATACAYRAVLSRYPPTASAESPIEVTVPIPGTNAEAPVTPPIAVTSRRYCLSRRRSICSGVSCGCAARSFFTMDSARGRCRRSTVSSALVSAGRGLPSLSKSDFLASSMFTSKACLAECLMWGARMANP